MDMDPRKHPWESDVSWMNTHLEGLDDRDIHHVGQCVTKGDGDLVVLRCGSDNDDKPHFTILLTPDQADDLAGALRMAAR